MYVDFLKILIFFRLPLFLKKYCNNENNNNNNSDFDHNKIVKESKVFKF